MNILNEKEAYQPSQYAIEQAIRTLKDTKTEIKMLEGKINNAIMVLGGNKP